MGWNNQVIRVEFEVLESGDRYCKVKYDTGHIRTIPRSQITFYKRDIVIPTKKKSAKTIVLEQFMKQWSNAK